MLERVNYKILHIGEIPFNISWKQWYLKIEEYCHCKIIRETQNNLSAFTGKGKLGSLGHENLSEKNLFQDYDLVRIHRSFIQEAFNLVNAASHLISNIKVVDLFFKKSGTMWPHLNFKDGLHSAILQSHPYLNTKGSGLIIGETVEAIQAAYVLAELGLKHITFVIEHDRTDSLLLEKIKKSLFQINFEFITKEKIILLPGIYSVMVCCADLKNNPELLTSILYFNYLERGGLILNAVYPLEKVPLKEEALAIGANCKDLPYIQAHEEVMALQHIIHQPLYKLIKEE